METVFDNVAEAVLAKKRPGEEAAVINTKGVSCVFFSPVLRPCYLCVSMQKQGETIKIC